MKLYNSNLAPNPRRVRVFLAEKGVAIPRVEVDLAKLEQKTPEFSALNPFQTIPVLELDDGARIAESIAICRTSRNCGRSRTCSAQPRSSGR
jgi:glutathione S-transferase